MSIKQQIIEYAKSISIDIIGFSDIDFSSQFYKALIERKKNGHLSGFEENDENKRCDVSALLNNARTLISIALPYRTCDADKTRPYFSKSTFGMDYHIVMKEKLKNLSDFITLKYNSKCVYFSDTGPLSDREIAKKCGIGFYGKNASIITDAYGSFVFLGEIITDLFVERDVESESRCGNCTRCIDACPAGAIEKPYYINAKKCLSYLTQKKDNLTSKEADNMGLRIFGCDTCQDACPYNNGVRQTDLKCFVPQSWILNVNEESILNMSNSKFKKTFRLTSSGWRGLKLLKRNLIIAMGNSMDKDYIPYLEKIIDDDKLGTFAKCALKKIMSKN